MSWLLSPAFLNLRFLPSNETESTWALSERSNLPAHFEYILLCSSFLDGTLIKNLPLNNAIQRTHCPLVRFAAANQPKPQAPLI
jgi:hypothetical protein